MIQLTRFLVNDRTHALAAHLHDAVRGVLRFDHRRAIVDMLHHGLFAIDIFAGLHGVDGDLAVPVIGRADDDGIDIFASEDLFVILSGEDVRAVDFLHVREAPVVAIAGGYQFGEPGGYGGMRIALPHAAAANEGDLDFVVGGDFGSLGFGAAEATIPAPAPR